MQGATELFPVSSLGHSVLVPAWIGGSWQTLVTQSSQANSESSFYLAFIVALHVATALALLWFFRADWVRIIAGFFRSVARSARAARCDRGLRRAPRLADRDRDDPRRPHRAAVRAPLPDALAKPVAASVFLFVNGLILLARRSPAPRAGGRRRGRARPTLRAAESAIGRGPAAAAPRTSPRPTHPTCASPDLATATACGSGSLQILALFAGISRSGITMVGGLWRGLSYEDAARFAFLLATPVILAAGVLKMPTLLGKAGDHIHGQVIVGIDRLRRRRLPLRPLPRPLLRDPQPAAVRDLLPDRGRRQPGPVRRFLGRSPAS